MLNSTTLDINGGQPADGTKWTGGYVRDRHIASRNTAVPSGNSSILKGEVFDVDATKSVGMKRPRSYSPQAPALNRFKSNHSSSEHLVYVRRKLETEHGKPNPSCDAPNDGSSKPQNVNLYGKQPPNGLQKEDTMPRLSSFSSYQPNSGAPTESSVAISRPSFSEKPLTGFPVLEPNNPGVNVRSPPLVNNNETRKLHWKDRFVQVQAFLRARDQSNQEEYIQTLRSLSPIERSNHAVALEKRAIRLLLEEGKELHLMRVLNVFGKDSPKNKNSAFIEHSTLPAAEESKPGAHEC